MIDELKSLPKSPHDDAQDAAALAIPPMAGIIGATAAILNPKLKDAHVEIPREQDIFKPTKSALDFLSEQNRIDTEKYMAKFGEQNGYPVIFVTTFRQFDPPKEDIVNKAFINTEINIQMFKKSEMRKAADFARRNGGELGIFDPPKSKEVERLEKERDYWKSRCLREEDDGDSLGIFRHWND